MKRQLWAPWRIKYILGPKPDECVFCIPDDPGEDASRLVLLRGDHCFVVMNKFPYNNGHLLVCPYRHVSELEELAIEESAELMRFMQLSSRLLKKHFKCEGINIGLNQGKAAGAGVKDHLHFHLVPRWNGDSSFIAVMDDIRSIPQFLEETYANLLPAFQAEADRIRVSL